MEKRPMETRADEVDRLPWHRPQARYLIVNLDTKKADRKVGSYVDGQQAPTSIEPDN